MNLLDRSPSGYRNLGVGLALLGYVAFVLVRPADPVEAGLWYVVRPADPVEAGLWYGAIALLAGVLIGYGIDRPATDTARA